MSFLDEDGNAHEIAFDAYAPRQDLDLVDGSDTNVVVQAILTQNDTVAGTGGIDRIFAEKGSNTVDGFGGDDVLSGGNGDDSLTGGTGKDSLEGGTGDDILSGGEGSDVFLFNTEEVRLDDGTVVDATPAPLGFGRDVITDFELGADKIDLRKVAGVSSFVDEDLRVSDTEGGALIEIGESSILLEGVDAGDLTQGDFLFDQRVVMEYGSLSVGGDFITVDLDTSFKNPVVLAFVDGVAQPGIITTRLRNLENDSFQIRLQASDGHDPDLAQERVDYVVVEAGTHVLGNGAVLEAGLVSTDKVQQSTLREGLEKVDLTADFGGDAPAVFSTLNTYNGRDFTTTRVTNATGDGFDVAMAELEANTDGHVLEDIAFLAISTRQLRRPDRRYVGGRPVRRDLGTRCRPRACLAHRRAGPGGGAMGGRHGPALHAGGRQFRRRGGAYDRSCLVAGLHPGGRFPLRLRAWLHRAGFGAGAGLRPPLSEPRWPAFASGFDPTRLHGGRSPHGGAEPGALHGRFGRIRLRQTG